MKKQQVKYLKKLIETPSATGCEQSVAAVVRERMALFADEVSTDTMGSVHATLQGASDDGAAAPTLMLAEKKVKPSMIMNIVTMPRRA